MIKKAKKKKKKEKEEWYKKKDKKIFSFKRPIPTKKPTNPSDSKKNLPKSDPIPTIQYPYFKSNIL